MATGNFFKHWPTMLLGVVVAVILLIAVFSYQLNQTESAVVTTFGSPAAVTEPGLHFRWPFPFQRIYRFDHRIDNKSPIQPIFFNIEALQTGAKRIERVL